MSWGPDWVKIGMKEYHRLYYIILLEYCHRRRAGRTVVRRVSDVSGHLSLLTVIDLVPVISYIPAKTRKPMREGSIPISNLVAWENTHDSET